MGQFSKIDLKTVFTYPLGAMPWSLADASGFIRKRNKSQLAQLLQKNILILERYPANACNIYDGTAVPLKNAERSKRSSKQEGVRYKNISTSFQLKSCCKFLSVSSNKTEVVKFIVSEWKEPEFTSKLESKLLFVILGEECWKLGSTGIKAVPELQSNHEEADMRMILHAEHAQGPCIIHADDTDVLVLILSHSNRLDAAYVKAGRGSRAEL